MKTVTIRDKEWIGSQVNREGLHFISELPGEFIGAVLNTKEVPARLQVLDSKTGVVLLQLNCDKGHQKDEKILTESKRHNGLSVYLSHPAEGVVFHQPFDVSKSLNRIEQLLEKAYEPQWVQEYQYNLDTAATNKLIGEFPTKPRYLMVHTCTGVVTARFNSQNEPSWTLAAKDQFCFPFEQLYLTWTVQGTKRLTIYISNKEIFRSTLR